MSNSEIQAIKNKYYFEALRYYENAKDALKKVTKANNIYKDIKYVRSACSFAYSGVLVAMQGFCLIKGIKIRKNEKIDIYFFQRELPKIDNKLFGELDLVYKILHRMGYYDGIDDAIVIKRGFEHASKVIGRIKPAGA